PRGVPGWRVLGVARPNVALWPARTRANAVQPHARPELPFESPRRTAHTPALDVGHARTPSGSRTRQSSRAGEPGAGRALGSRAHRVGRRALSRLPLERRASGAARAVPKLQ